MGVAALPLSGCRYRQEGPEFYGGDSSGLGIADGGMLYKSSTNALAGI